MRIEVDCLGEVALPDEAYYGAQTERARKNFLNMSGRTLDDFPDLIRAMAAIKKAAAQTNLRLFALAPQVAEAIARAADEVMEGKMAGQFPVDFFQGGGGVSLHMNINEVLANRANELLTGEKGAGRVHPNTHVNLSQSTNDVLPSAARLCCGARLGDLEGALLELEGALQVKVSEHADTVKLGRTCLQDALPMTFGQHFSGYLSMVQRQREALSRMRPRCQELTLGATALGTGLGLLEGYLEGIYPALSAILGSEVRPEANFFDAMQNEDFYATLSGQLRSLAVGLSKMATDLRLLSSGPRAGMGNLELPALQPGSSIMPGKINPTLPELINQVCYQVCGNDLTIAMAVEGGELDLNVWLVVILKNLFESLHLLTQGTRLFVRLCISGLVVHVARCRAQAESSLALSTVLSALVGYEKAAHLAQKARASDQTIGALAVAEGLLSADEAALWLDPLALSDPKRSAALFSQILEAARGH